MCSKHSLDNVICRYYTCLILVKNRINDDTSCIYTTLFESLLFERRCYWGSSHEFKDLFCVGGPLYARRVCESATTVVTEIGQWLTVNHRVINKISTRSWRIYGMITAMVNFRYNNLFIYVYICNWTVCLILRFRINCYYGDSHVALFA